LLVAAFVLLLTGYNIAVVDDAVDFLSSSLGSPSKAGKSSGGFRLNYDYETPIRSIDVGGADQAQRLDIF
jgi:hypothetical protein